VEEREKKGKREVKGRRGEERGNYQIKLTHFTRNRFQKERQTDRQTSLTYQQVKSSQAHHNGRKIYIHTRDIERIPTAHCSLPTTHHPRAPFFLQCHAHATGIQSEVLFFLPPRPESYGSIKDEAKTGIYPYNA